MNGIGVSAVTAYTAHREWASRPPDERYASVHALYDAARARRLRTEERTIETVALRTEAVASDALALRDTSGRQAALTNWSFEQLAGIAAAPPKYLRTLPAAIASDAINYGLRRQRREQHQLLVDRDEPWTVHAVTSPRYARVHHDELAGRVLDLMTQHPAWSLPLGYKDGVFGAERVPSGAYLGDRDMFLFLVDGNRDLDDPTDRVARWLVPRIHSPEQRRRCRRPDPGCVPVPRRVRQPHHLGLPARRRLPAPTRGCVDSGGLDDLARERPRPPSTQTPRTIASSSCGPRPRNSGRRVTRSLTRLCSDSSCRRSRPQRRTRWRKRSRRIPVRSGATCKGSRV